MNNETLEILNNLVKQVNKVMLTKKEVALLLGLSTTTIDNYIKREMNLFHILNFRRI